MTDCLTIGWNPSFLILSKSESGSLYRGYYGAGTKFTHAQQVFLRFHRSWSTPCLEQYMLWCSGSVSRGVRGDADQTRSSWPAGIARKSGAFGSHSRLLNSFLASKKMLITVFIRLEKTCETYRLTRFGWLIVLRLLPFVKQTMTQRLIKAFYAKEPVKCDIWSGSLSRSFSAIAVPHMWTAKRYFQFSLSPNIYPPLFLGSISLYDTRPTAEIHTLYISNIQFEFSLTVYRL